MTRGASQLQSLGQLLPGNLGERLEPHARQVKLRAGQIVIAHQDRTNDVFVVLEGALRVELHSLNGRDVILAELSAGELIGEYAALDDDLRSATVTAVTECRLAVIPGDIFRAEVHANAETAEWLTRRLVSRIRQLTERIFELNALAVRDRLHCELLRMCLDVGIAHNEATIDSAPTHHQLARRIGTHREAVTRELQYLHKQGILTQDGRRLTVRDVAALADIVRAAAGDIDVILRAIQP